MSICVTCRLFTVCCWVMKLFLGWLLRVLYVSPLLMISLFLATVLFHKAGITCALLRTWYIFIWHVGLQSCLSVPPTRWHCVVEFVSFFLLFISLFILVFLSFLYKTATQVLIVLGRFKRATCTFLNLSYISTLPSLHCLDCVVPPITTISKSQFYHCPTLLPYQQRKCTFI